MPSEQLTLVAGQDDSGRRLDRILRAALRDLPLSSIYRLLREGRVRLGGRRAEGSDRIVSGDRIEVRLPAWIFAVTGAEGVKDGASSALPSMSVQSAADAKRFADALIVETDDIAFINKPKGALSHGPGGIDEWTRAYYADRIAASIAFIPAPLHRLDRNTTGALAISASAKGAMEFSEALREGRIGKTYVALLEGAIEADASWVDRLRREESSEKSVVGPEGSIARSSVSPLATAQGLTLALVAIATGRKHQIRAQSASRGHPLSGDVKYGGKSRPGGYLLHCARLEIPPGVASPDAMVVTAPLPLRARLEIERQFGVELFSLIPWLSGA